MKIRCILLVATLFFILLCGCGRNATEPTVTPTTALPTEEVLATVPTTLPAEPTEVTAPTAPTEESTPTAPQGITGSFEIRLSDWDTDDDGTYLTYTGGEMEVPMLISGTGDVLQEEIGILLFVDGQPQPYRTESSQEYAYMHTFRFTKSSFNKITLWFIPITGEAGAAPEVYAKPLLDPYRTLATNRWPSLGTTPAIMFRLKYQTTPPTAVFPEKQLLLTQTTISYKDTTYQEIGTWTEEELLSEIEHHLYLNGKQDDHDTPIYEISNAGTIPLRYEIWGSPDVHYSIVFFVDHQPVFAQDGLPVSIGIHSGQKTIVEATLSMTAFDGESLVYAILVPRNYAEAKNHCFLDCTKVFFLTEQIDPDSSTL